MTNTIKTILLLSIIAIIVSCQGEIYLSDEDLIIEKKELSPNGDKILVSYSIDNGAFGQSRMFNSIINITDTLKPLNKDQNDLNSRFLNIQEWISNDELIATIDPRPFARKNLPVDTSSIHTKLAKVKIKIEDVSKGNPPIIEYFELSPNHKKLLVAYRYKGASELEVSVINRDENLPKIGNIYSSFRIGNPLLSGKWLNNNTIEFEINTNSLTKDLHQGALCKSNYQIEFKNIDYKSPYSSIIGGWYNKPLYRNEQASELFSDPIEIEAIIVEGIQIGDGSYTKKRTIYYEYEFAKRKYKSYFRIKSNNQELSNIERIKILIDKNQPIISRTIKKYDR